MRRIFVACLSLWLGAFAAFAEIDAWALAQRLLAQGEPEQAIELARRAMQAANDEDKRRWLSLIAEAEWMRAKARHFSDPQLALAAIDALAEAANGLAPVWLLRRARLLRAAGKLDEAIVAARKAMAAEDDELAAKAAIEEALIHLARGHEGEASAALLEAIVRAPQKSPVADRARAWLGLLDARAGRDAQALRRLDAVFQRHPLIVEREAEVLAGYVALLAKKDRRSQALALAQRFIDLHGANSALAWRVRLIRAEVWQRSGERKKAMFAYAKLAEDAKGSGIGALAELRAQMLALAEEGDEKHLKAAIAKIERIAARHQFSPVEDEALLDLALLWSRLTPELGQNGEEPALGYFSRAASGMSKSIARKAKALGAKRLQALLEQAVRQGKTKLAVLLWRRYANLRPDAKAAPELYLAMARAFRLIGDAASAQQLVAAVLSEHANDLYHERAMVERARIWLAQGEVAHFGQLMRWLGLHADTIYRPELLLIAAQMRLAAGKPAEARQLLLQIAAEDLVSEMKVEYWQARAQAAEALQRWAEAANAWQQAGSYARAGFAWFEFGDCVRARELWRKVPEQARDNAWRYHMAVCDERLGMRKQAEALWREIVDKGGDWAPEAELELAISTAERSK